MIEVKGLKKSFGPKQVLKGVSAKLSDGEVLSIIGGSGSGKSTFIKCVVRLLQPDAGSIIVNGRETANYKTEYELSLLRRQFGYLFQEGALFDSLSVAENVAFGLKYLTNIPETRYRSVARDMLALVGLQNVEDLRPSELSGGMKKRVSLARALAPGPKYMLYDEPTSGLDPIMSDIINDLIIDLKNKTGLTSIVITHDMNSAFKISNHIVMLHEGQFLLTGKPEDFRTCGDPRVRQFVDGSAEGPIKMKIRDLD
ncbi:MAG TPA: ABC transporter ATP-binding protein [Elusimicrobiales bacterium]|nr:ABC transporter ATP-binding protein [Elusimicrobiales bacterium]